MKKYELTDDKIEVAGITLCRIKRISDGVLGGYLESEDNLSHYEDAWVSGNAKVFGDARVRGKASVYGNAWVRGNARVYGDAWVRGNARVYGDAKVYGNAKVCGNTRVEKLSDVCNITNQAFNITITRQNIVIGCQSKTYAEWSKVTKKQAEEMGICVLKYRYIKKLVKLIWKNI